MRYISTRIGGSRGWNSTIERRSWIQVTGPFSPFPSELWIWHNYWTSLLDARVFWCTHHQSDHELFISAIRFTIKANHLHHSMISHIQTQDLPPRDMVMSFQSALLDAHSTICHTASALSGVESIWTSFKVAITAACNKQGLPKAGGWLGSWWDEKPVKEEEGSLNLPLQQQEFTHNCTVQATL